MDDIERAFRSGFTIGFGVSREGFNGGCAYGHCAPGAARRFDDPVEVAIEDAAVLAYRAGDDAFASFKASVDVGEE